MVQDIAINLAASAIFLALLAWSMRPRLRVATLIDEHLEPVDGHTHYSFRIQNQSWFLVRDIRVSLKRVKSNAGTWVFEELAQGDFAFIKGRRPAGPSSASESVCIFSRPLDLRILWTPEHHLELHVFATHALSGMSGFAEAKYLLPWEQSVRRLQQPSH